MLVLWEAWVSDRRIKLWLCSWNWQSSKGKRKVFLSKQKNWQDQVKVFADKYGVSGSSVRSKTQIRNFRKRWVKIIAEVKAWRNLWIWKGELIRGWVKTLKSSSLWVVYVKRRTFKQKLLICWFNFWHYLRLSDYIERHVIKIVI